MKNTFLKYFDHVYNHGHDTMFLERNDNEWSYHYKMNDNRVCINFDEIIIIDELCQYLSSKIDKCAEIRLIKLHFKSEEIYVQYISDHII